MNEAIYLGQRSLPKKPIDVINRHSRLYHKLNIIKRDQRCKNLKDSNIYITVYDENKHIVVDRFTINNLPNNWKSKTDILKNLIVLDEQYIYDRHQLASKVNSKKYVVTDLDCIDIKVKYLPSNYVRNPLYMLGYINDIIYDMIISKEKEQPGETVLGTEAYKMISSYLSEKTNNKSVQLLDVEKAITRLCGFSIELKPSSYSKDNVPEYYIIRKILVKS